MVRPNTARVITYYIRPPVVPTLPVLPSLTVCIGGPGKCMGTVRPITPDHTHGNYGAAVALRNYGASCDRHEPSAQDIDAIRQTPVPPMPVLKHNTLLADHTRRFPRGESVPSERQNRVNRCDRDEDGDSKFCAGRVEVYSVPGDGARVLCETHADAAVDYATVVAAFTSTSAGYRLAS